MQLFSGNCPMGICGTETELADSYGELLYVGDLVCLYCEKYKEELTLEGPEFVVDNGEGPFIMGIKGSRERQTEYYLDGVESDSSHFDYHVDYYLSLLPGHRWLVKKIKPWDQTVPGETWGSGNITVRE